MLTQAELDRALVDAHWKFLAALLGHVYTDAMLHGIKHGREDKKENDENSKVDK